MLTPQTLLLIMAAAIIFMAWYANMSKRDKILCTFRRVNKTKIVKWVKMNSRYVIFDHRKYDIIPSRIVSQWYTAGLVHMLFPQWVQTLDFTYSSRWPHDPNTMSVNLDDPAIRDALNKQEWVESYVKGATPKGTNKRAGGFLDKYLPWLAIAAVVLVGFWMYQNQQNLAHQFAILNNTVNSRLPKP